MQTNMDDQQMALTNTRAPMTNSMVHALDRFITPNLSQHGWLTTDEDTQDLSCEILKNFVDLCHAGNSRRFILETLSDDKTHLEVAEWLSTIFLGQNPGPKDRELLSFTAGVIRFFHDLCWDHFARGWTADNGSQIVSDGGLSTYTEASRQTETFHLLKLPAELRNMVYREALVVPDGGLVRTFAPPALLRANKQIREEGIPLFYGQNHFQITVKRSAQDEACAGGTMRPNVDMWVWRRFLHMWDDFNCFGANCLRYVRHITLIYQLSIDDGYSFGDGLYDRCLGFRLSSEPFEKDHHDRSHGEDERGRESVPDTTSGQVIQSDPAEIEAEAADSDADDGEVEQVPEDHPDPVGVFELNRGTVVNWGSRREAHFFLFHRMCEYGTDGMWDVYPMKRLGQMLWRCARDCPLSSANVDLICEDLPYWMDSIGSYTRHSVDFYDLDDDDD